MQRFWLLFGRLLTSADLRQIGASRLRAVDLGRCETLAEARARAAKHITRDPAAIIAHNVRRACDTGSGARWGLSQDQIARLRAGENIDMADNLGRFVIGYTGAAG